MNKVRQNVVSIAPPIDRNVIWIDISGAEPVQKIFLDGEWKTFKDSDVDAEFATGEKVSNISIEKSNPSSTSAADKKLVTLQKVAATLSGYHERATFTGTTGDVTVYYNNVLNNNAVISAATSITLTRQLDDYNTDSVTTVRFTSGNTPTTLEYNENHLKWANEEIPTIEANAEYIIAIWNCIAVISKLNTISNS